MAETPMTPSQQTSTPSSVMGGKRIVAWIVAIIVLAIIGSVLMMSGNRMQNNKDEDVAQFLNDSTPAMTDAEQQAAIDFVRDNPTETLTPEQQQASLDLLTGTTTTTTTTTTGTTVNQ
jgi:hypothetical protein